MERFINKKPLEELVGGDIFSDGGDRNIVKDKEIETGPVDKPYNDNSDYQKGVSVTTDKVTSRYRQDIPWFAVYSFGGSRIHGGQLNNLSEDKKNLTKRDLEEIIEDLVKKKQTNDVTDKNYNPKINKIIDTINDSDFTEEQLEELTKLIQSKKETGGNTNKTL